MSTRSIFIVVIQRVLPLALSLSANAQEVCEVNLINCTAANSYCGSAVAIGPEFAIVGAGGADLFGTQDVGRVDLYRRVAERWRPHPPLWFYGQSAGAQFGASASLDGLNALIGSPGASHFAVGAGAAYVLRGSSDQSWWQEARLDAPDSGPSDAFGTSVAIRGNWAVVGAPYWEGNPSSNSNYGAVYVFRRSASTWTPHVRLTPASVLDYFGYSVSLDGNVMVASAVGDRSAYLYKVNGVTWTLHSMFEPSDEDFVDNFGWTLALSSGTVLVGAPDFSYADLSIVYHYAVTGADSDSDSFNNLCDNCPFDPNVNQRDQDEDGTGDVCDDDLDGDGVSNVDDNCPEDSNADQSNIDADAEGDVCDEDVDGDDILNWEDNCPRAWNPDQLDVDENGVGDVCQVGPLDCERQRLEPPPPYTESFGQALALGFDSKQTLFAVVGVPRTPVGGYYIAGAVHIFRRIGDVWDADGVLLSPNPISREYFGFALAQVPEQ